MNAARILGAGFWHQMRYLILPMMKAIILIALIIRSIEAFKLFDAAYLLTAGGPGEATTNISLYLFDETAQNTRWGYACAVAIIVLIFVSVVGFWAIRPIEAAQEETLEELTGAGAEPGAGAGGAAEHRGRDRGGGEGLMATDDPQTSIPSLRALWRGRLRGVASGADVSLLGGVFAFPLYWVVTMAFKPQPEWNPPGKVYWFPREPDLGQLQGHPRPPGRERERLRDGTSTLGDRAAHRTSSSPRPAERSSRWSSACFAAYGIARFRAGGRQLPFQILQLRMFPPIAIDDPAALHVRRARASGTRSRVWSSSTARSRSRSSSG